jgi:hypothetical protein
LQERVSDSFLLFQFGLNELALILVGTETFFLLLLLGFMDNLVEVVKRILFERFPIFLSFFLLFDSFFILVAVIAIRFFGNVGKTLRLLDLLLFVL